MTDTIPAGFAASLTGSGPPPTWSAALTALWWLARDPSGSDAAVWERAHALVQSAPGPEAAWVHAHLHRIEGDPDNARYWYDRAGRAGPSGTSEGERAAIIAALWDRA
jgi:hypothetical protein